MDRAGTVNNVKKGEIVIFSDELDGILMSYKSASISQELKPES